MSGIQPTRLELALHRYAAQIEADNDCWARLQQVGADKRIDEWEWDEVFAVADAGAESQRNHRGIYISFRKVLVHVLKTFRILRFGDEPGDTERIDQELMLIAQLEAEQRAGPAPKKITSLDVFRSRSKAVSPVHPGA